MASSDGLGEIKKLAASPFSCICTLHYYDAKSLLKQPDFRLF